MNITKQDLQKRLDSLRVLINKIIQEQAELDAQNKAEIAVSLAEKTLKVDDIVNAQSLVDKVGTATVKKSLQNRLDKIRLTVDEIARRAQADLQMKADEAKKLLELDLERQKQEANKKITELQGLVSQGGLLEIAAKTNIQAIRTDIKAEGIVVVAVENKISAVDQLAAARQILNEADTKKEKKAANNEIQKANAVLVDAKQDLKLANIADKKTDIAVSKAEVAVAKAEAVVVAKAETAQAKTEVNLAKAALQEADTKKEKQAAQKALEEAKKQLEKEQKEQAKAAEKAKEAEQKAKEAEKKAQKATAQAQQAVTTGKSCFTSNTKIKCSNSNEIEIKDIRIGTEILTYNFIKNKNETAIVKNIEKGTDNLIIKITLDDNNILYSTTTHPYYVTNKGFSTFNPDLYSELFPKEEKTKKLEINDILIDINSNTYYIKNIEEIHVESIDVYNLIIDGNQNYYANNILVGN